MIPKHRHDLALLLHSSIIVFNKKQRNQGRKKSYSPVVLTQTQAITYPLHTVSHASSPDYLCPHTGSSNTAYTHNSQFLLIEEPLWCLRMGFWKDNRVHLGVLRDRNLQVSSKRCLCSCLIIVDGKNDYYFLWWFYTKNLIDSLRTGFCGSHSGSEVFVFTELKGVIHWQEYGWRELHGRILVVFSILWAGSECGSAKTLSR